MYAAQERRIVVHGLEIYGKVEISNEDNAQVEECSSRCGMDGTLSQHGEWHHGLVSPAILPNEKHSKGDGGSDKKTDDC